MKTQLSVMFLALIGTTSLSFALVFPDQEVTRVGSGTGENENDDAVSRFGSNVTRQDQERAKFEMKFRPISEASFEPQGNRAPASAPEAGSKVKVEASSTDAPASAVIRAVQKRKAYQEVAVIVNELGFYPSTLFLTQGIGVRLFITGASEKSQCFILDQFGVRRQVRPKKVEEITFMPDLAGTFSFNCPMSGAKGVVVVKELELGALRTPASETEHAESAQVSRAAPYLSKPLVSEIKDEDFTPEFRN